MKTQLFAKIRKDSKYYPNYVNFLDDDIKAGEQIAFPCHISTERWRAYESSKDNIDGGVVYNEEENGNGYRLSDVDLYVKDHNGDDFKISDVFGIN